MNGHALLRGIDEFAPYASEKSYLFSWLQIMRAWSADMAVAVAKSIDSKEGGAVHTYLRSIMAEVRAVKARALFSSIEETAEALSRLGATLGEGDDGTAARARRHLNQFSESYESFIETPTPRSVYMLVLSADMLRNAIITLAGLLSGIRDRVLETALLAGEGRLAVLLPAPVTFAEFTAKLCALRDSYEVAGRLLCHDGEVTPLKVARIESSATWICVIGRAQVMDLLARAIERTALWVYQHQPIDDPGAPIQTLPAESARGHLDLDQHLPGPPTPIDEAEVGRVAAALMARIAVLVRGQPEIEVNGRVISVGDISRERFLLTP